MHILLIILGALLTLFGGGCAILLQGDYPVVWLVPLGCGVALLVWGIRREREKRRQKVGKD